MAVRIAKEDLSCAVRPQLWWRHRDNSELAQMPSCHRDIINQKREMVASRIGSASQPRGPRSLELKDRVDHRGPGPKPLPSE